MKRRRFYLLSLSLIGGLAFPLRPAVAEAPAASPAPSEPTPLQRVYYFEHRLLPDWVHKTEGAFFADLEQGQTGKLTAAATAIVGKDFAAGLKVRKIGEPAGVLIVFPQPQEVPECFFAAVLKDGQKFRYVTLELTDDLLHDGTKTCLCEWAGDGSHLNFGARKFDDEASFIAELKERAHKESNPPPAAVTSPAKP